MKITVFFLVVALVGFAAAYPAEGDSPQAGVESIDVVPEENLAEGVAPADLARDSAAHFGGYYGGYRRRPYYGGGFGHYGGGFGFGGGYYRRRPHYW